MTHLDDDDLRALIDGSFGDGPPAGPLGPTLVAGHRAVRRRRATLGSGVVAALLVVTVGGFALRTSVGDDRGDHVPAAPTTVSPDGVRYPVVVGRSSSFSVGSGPVQVVRHEPRLEVLPGTEVLGQVDDPYGADATWSVALLLRHDGRTAAYLARWEPDGESVVDGTDTGLGQPFDVWVAAEVRRQRAYVAADPLADGIGGGRLVDLQADGDVRTQAGVELLDVVPDPYDRDDDENLSVAVALRHEGRERWAVLRHLDPGGAVSLHTTFADEARADTFAAYVRAQEARLYPRGSSR